MRARGGRGEEQSTAKCAPALPWKRECTATEHLNTSYSVREPLQDVPFYRDPFANQLGTPCARSHSRFTARSAPRSRARTISIVKGDLIFPIVFSNNLQNCNETIKKSWF